MTLDAWLTLGIIVVLFALLIWDQWPTWAVFSLALTAVITLGLADEGAALSGFSNSGVLTVVVLYAVAAGMYRTGAVSMIISALVGQPSHDRAANLRILPVTAFGSAFLNNTPIVAMLVPVVRDLGRSARLAVSRIYMAVSNASILGGASTLVGTSTNLIIAGLVVDTFDEDLGIFFPTRVGLPAAIVGLVFLVFVAARLFPADVDAEGDADLVRRCYRAEFFLPEGSRLAGRTVQQAGFANPVGSSLDEVRRNDGTIEVSPDLVLAEGDALVFNADIEAVPTLWSTIGLVGANPPGRMRGEYAHRLTEVVVAEGASIVGAPLDADDLVHGHQKIIGVSRGMGAPGTPISEFRIASGDNLVLEVREEFLDATHDEYFALVRRLHGYRVQRVSRAWAAAVIVLVMVLLSAFGIMSLFNAALLAVTAMLVTGCITFRAVWRSIDWTIYVVLAAAVGLEPAVTQSGLAAVVSDGLTTLAGGNSLAALAVVFLGAILLTNVVTNAAAAALMFPITVGIVTDLDVAWEPYIAVLMLGCSYAFINPASYQTHLMVFEPGGYAFNDFVKVGIPLTILLGVLVVPLAALLYGL